MATGSGIALDAAGAAYIVGSTTSFDLPVTPGAFQMSPGITTDADTVGGGASVYDAFVAKIGADDAPGLALAPATTPFSSQRLGTTSPAHQIRLLAAGSEPLAIASIEASGDFAQTNTCGSLLAPGATCSISVTFAPTAIGDRAGAITFVDNAAGSPHVLPLGGSGIDPQVALSATSLTFAGQDIGTTSAAQTVSLSNPGSTDLYVDQIAATGDFAQTSTCGQVVGPGASCTISVSFTPTIAGTRTGSLYIRDNAAGSPRLISLTGTATGTGPVVVLSPDRLTFGTQGVGTTSAPQAVTLSNTGNGSLTISGIAVFGALVQTNTCGNSVAAGASCIFSVSFAPTYVGIQSGRVTITDNAPGSPHVVNGTGTGAAPWVALSPSTLTFGSQRVGTTSAAQTVTLSNTGGADLTISSIMTSGDFAQTNTCGSTVAPGADCTISVTFAPTATGSRTGAVTITHDAAAGSPHVVSLSGTGTAPAVALSPSTLTFGSQRVGTTSAAQTVSLSNTGGADLDHLQHRRQWRLRSGQYLRERGRPRGRLHDQRHLCSHRHRIPDGRGDHHGRRRRQPACRFVDRHRNYPRGRSVSEHLDVWQPAGRHHERRADGDSQQHRRRRLDHLQHRDHRRLRPDQYLRQQRGRRRRLHDPRHLYAQGYGVPDGRGDDHGRRRRQPTRDRSFRNGDPKVELQRPQTARANTITVPPSRSHDRTRRGDGTGSGR